ncbi:MAG: hypothetical protein LC676_18345 [Loktanella sp.]|nr:hypothetical protein [Loktanella sp.]
MATLRALPSRLLVVLALVLFGTPQSFADERVAHLGSALESQVQQAEGILTGQRQLLRGPLSEDTSQDVIVPGAMVQIRHQILTDKASASLLSFVSVSTSSLPPVRGPPAV